MNAHLFYWIYLVLVLMVNLILIRKKGLKLIDYFMAISVMGASAVGDQIIGGHFHLFTYINVNIDDLYSAFYIALVYPACGLWFSMFFPKSTSTKVLLNYNLKWLIFLLSVEKFIINQFNIIVYTGWKIIPHSLIFYTLTLPIFTFYYIYIQKLLKRRAY